jgi:hypothetical protein
MTRHSPTRITTLALLGALAASGCSIRQTAINKVGDAMAETGANFASDDDPELVGDAVPFGLKTMEGLLESAPRHRGLLLAASSGFAQYAYGWLQLEADYVEAKDLARDYGLRGLEVELPGFAGELQKDPGPAVARARAKHVPLLYWTAVGWAGAIALKVNDSEVAADQKLVEALARRALALEPCWGLGSIHEFFVSWEAARASIGGSLERAREHYEQDLACAQGRRAFPYVTYAESVSVPKQDKAQFEQLMREALAQDVSRKDDQRLANLLAQKRARFQLGRLDELFIE